MARSDHAHLISALKAEFLQIVPEHSCARPKNTGISIIRPQPHIPYPHQFTANLPGKSVQRMLSGWLFAVNFSVINSKGRRVSFIWWRSEGIG